MGHHWSMGKQSEATPLKKTDSPLFRSHQLSIDTQVGAGAHEPPLHFIGLVLCRDCTANYNCCQFLSTEVLSCPENTNLFQSFLTLALRVFQQPLLQ